MVPGVKGTRLKMEEVYCSAVVGWWVLVDASCSELRTSSQRASAKEEEVFSDQSMYTEQKNVTFMCRSITQYNQSGLY